jgi:hypothetical protein
MAGMRCGMRCGVRCGMRCGVRCVYAADADASDAFSVRMLACMQHENLCSGVWLYCRRRHF